MLDQNVSQWIVRNREIMGASFEKHSTDGLNLPLTRTTEGLEQLDEEMNVNHFFG